MKSAGQLFLLKGHRMSLSVARAAARSPSPFARRWGGRSAPEQGRGKGKLVSGRGAVGGRSGRRQFPYAGAAGVGAVRKRDSGV